MGVLNHLNGSGHSTLTWDPTDAKATAEAADEFVKLQQQGNLMVETKEGVGQEQINAFNPLAEEIIALRPIAGG